MTEGALYITSIFMNRFRSNRLNIVLLNLYPEQWKQVCVPGGGGYSTKFHTSRLRPEVQLRTLLYTIFDREGAAFVYLSLTNGTPFTYLV